MTGRTIVRPPEPLEGVLPLLSALPLPALLYRLDGTIFGASPAMEQLVGEPVDAMTNGDLASRLKIGFPEGRGLHWDDLCRDLTTERNPAVAVDINDSIGRFHAMIASGALVRSGSDTVGVLVLFSEVTGLLERSAAQPRHSLSSE